MWKNWNLTHCRCKCKRYNHCGDRATIPRTIPSYWGHCELMCSCKELGVLYTLCPMRESPRVALTKYCELGINLSLSFHHSGCQSLKSSCGRAMLPLKHLGKNTTSPLPAARSCGTLWPSSVHKCLAPISASTVMSSSLCLVSVSSPYNFISSSLIKDPLSPEGHILGFQVHLNLRGNHSTH